MASPCVWTGLNWLFGTPFPPHAVSLRNEFAPFSPHISSWIPACKREGEFRTVSILWALLTHHVDRTFYCCYLVGIGECAWDWAVPCEAVFFFVCFSLHGERCWQISHDTKRERSGSKRNPETPSSAGVARLGACGLCTDSGRWAEKMGWEKCCGQCPIGQK